MLRQVVVDIGHDRFVIDRAAFCHVGQLRQFLEKDTARIELARFFGHLGNKKETIRFGHILHLRKKPRLFLRQLTARTAAMLDGQQRAILPNDQAAAAKKG